MIKNGIRSKGRNGSASYGHRRKIVATQAVQGQFEAEENRRAEHARLAHNQTEISKIRSERLEKLKMFQTGDLVTNGRFYGKIVGKNPKSGFLSVVIRGTRKEESWNPEFTQKVLK